MSRVLPDKRYTTKLGPGYVMQITLRRAYDTFQKDFPNTTMSFSYFAKLRPKNVKILSQKYHDTCLCIYCANVKYKVNILKNLHNQKKWSGSAIQDEYQLVDALLCPMGENQ